MRVVVAAMLLCACGGAAEFESTADAPFDISGVKSALFAADSTSDARFAGAVLLLGTDKVGCEALQGITYESDAAGLMGDGSGLIAVFDHEDYDADRGGPAPDWQGKWTSGADAGGVEQHRALTLTVFEEGSVVEEALGAGGSVDLDTFDAKHVEGSFVHDYWTGTFRADNCGVFGK